MLNGGSAPGRNQEKALYRSDDGGQHWTLVADTGSAAAGSRSPPDTRSRVRPDRRDAATDLDPARPRGPFVGTLDGGAHWLDTGITTHVEQVVFVDPLHGWAWNGGGYRTTDGTHWIALTG